MTIAPYNPKASLKQYDRNFYAWTQEMAAALRSGDWAALDIENLEEEVESLRELGIDPDRL
jgi:hypothetical protein